MDVDDRRRAALFAWDLPSFDRPGPEFPECPDGGPGGVWCWHCCHPFDGVGVPLPTHYDDRRDVWKTKGTFCSFACAKAYNNGDGGPRSSIAGMLLALFKKRTTGTLARIIAAPPRRTLRVFGGSLSIREFRAKADDGIVITELPPRMVPIETIIEERKAAARRVRPRPAPDLTAAVDLSESPAAKNDMLRLRRPKPMPSDTNILARTMGLTLG
jgi:hypothetical protein